jgi:hypothetical protein
MPLVAVTKLRAGRVISRLKKRIVLLAKERLLK